MEVKEILIKNYLHWINTTKNQEHKQYARHMLSAVYSGTHADVFKYYGDIKNCNKKQNV